MRRRIEARMVGEFLGQAVALPEYATAGAAGMDLRAAIPAPVVIPAHGRVLVKTGLAINMMDPGMVAIVASRSGLSLKHGLRVAQGIGVIDADYHGEIGVILANDSEQDYAVQPGERIAQRHAARRATAGGRFPPGSAFALAYVDEFSTATERGAGGFGSTGKN